MVTIVYVTYILLPKNKNKKFADSVNSTWSWRQVCINLCDPDYKSNAISRGKKHKEEENQLKKITDMWDK